MKKYYFLGILLLLVGAYANTMAKGTPYSLNKNKVVAEDTFVFPAEFEEHESIWLAWPTNEKANGQPVEEVTLAMIRTLVPHVKVDLMVQDEYEQDQVQRIFTLQNIPSDNVRFQLIPHDDIWIRDMGPIFLKNSSETTNQKMIVADFSFNSWGCLPQYDAYSMNEEQVDRLVARDLEFPVLRSSIISEGGNREYNGKSTMMVTEVVELQRNPSWTKEQLEVEYKRIFNLQKVIWLHKGVAEDQLACKGKLPGGEYYSTWTTGGHIDEFARFVKEDTILLLEVSKEEAAEDIIAAITYTNMEENYRILKEATDQDGNPFTIIRAPNAAPIYQDLNKNDPMFHELRQLEYEDGTVIGEDDTITIMLPASYLNFVITNGVVIIPAYWKEGREETMRQKDEEFKTIMESVYPNREIVQINPENVNIGGGGMHCITQQMPVR
jgi:agmatine deiminase